MLGKRAGNARAYPKVGNGESVFRGEGAAAPIATVGCLGASLTGSSDWRISNTSADFAEALVMPISHAVPQVSQSSGSS